MSESNTATPAPDEKFCRDCGAAIKARAEICPKCGIRQLNPPESGLLGKKSRITAGIFALLLGGIGIHKFYLGQIGAGVLYVLFCWTLIPYLIALVEGIIYLTMDDAAFAAKYG